jgi:pyruvate dehydrogenase E2 component (dihydrolipoamide acetyltransferase)
MATEFKLPDLGENISSGDVVSLLVNVGDAINPQQDVIEIETDKAVIPVPCSVGGKVSKIHVKPGQTVKVGEVLLTLEESTKGVVANKPGAAPPKAAAKPAAKPEPAKTVPKSEFAKPAAAAAKPAPAKAAPAPAVATKSKSPAPAASSAAPPARQPVESGNGHSAAHAPEPIEMSPDGEDTPTAESPAAPAGPAVRRLARELGVNLSSVAGTGIGGRITREDVIGAVRHATGAAASAPQAATLERDSWGPIHREPISKIRKTIAANMVRSAFTIPHLTNFDDADITELERIRKGSVADYAGSHVKLTSLVFVIKAVALALKQHPTLNASIDLESGQIIYKDYVHLGVAVDTARGLVVPVLRDVDRQTISHIAQSLTAMAEKAKATQYSLDDLRGGTFTISNLGAIGGTYSTPIINYPEVAILLVGRSRRLPVVVEDRIEPRLMMPLSLSYDHRLVDGAAAARFLNEVIGYLESPGRLLLAP